MLRGTMAMALGAFVMTGCMAAPSETGETGEGVSYTRDEVRAMGGKGDHGVDLCDLLGWYGDGICDEFCSHPDSDCAAECVTNDDCPQPMCLIGGPCPRSYCVEGECVLSTNACDAGELECTGCHGETLCIPNTGGGCPLTGCPPPPPPGVCGGFAGFTCADGEFCDWDDDSCGAADRTGTCTQIPDAWIEIDAPVCGCDGATYGNTGEAHGHGTDIAHDGACTPPPPADCRTTGCGDGRWCSFCWGSFACIPDGALC